MVLLWFVQVWPWEDASLDDMELAFRRMRAMFEFLDKLGVDYWCFHDRCFQPHAPNNTPKEQVWITCSELRCPCKGLQANVS